MNRQALPGQSYLRQWRKLRRKEARWQKGKIIIEGFRLLTDACRAGVLPDVFFYNRDLEYSPELSDLNRLMPPATVRIPLPEDLIRQLAQTDTPQGVLAIASLPPAWKKLGQQDPQGSFFVLLDCLQDPGNMGAIMRTAVAAGVDAILWGRGNVDPTNPKALRASMGAAFSARLLEVDSSLALVKRMVGRRDLLLVASSPKASQSYQEVDYRQPVLLVIGNENSGVAPQILELVDAVVSIPIWGPVESLNAAVAAGLLIYEVARQRTM